METIYIDNQNLINVCVEVLNSSGLVIFPTETCYGIIADATNPDAVYKILKYKDRPEGRSIPIAVDSIEMAKKFVLVNEQADQLYQTFLPGPVTIISKSSSNLDPRLESENGNLGVRIPAYSKLTQLIKILNKPVVLTAANLNGKKTPYKIEDILENIGEKQKNLITLLVDSGELPHNPPSTVIDTTTSELTIYRSGRIDPINYKLVKQFKSDNELETISNAEILATELLNQKNAKPIFLLNGELGAGKTHFVKGFAKSLGIKNIIKSPTYNYFNEYRFDTKTNLNKLIHLDAWRIQSIDDLEALGFFEWFKNPNNIVVIEWPSVISNLAPDFFKTLSSFYYVDFVVINDTQREVKVYSKLEKEL